MEAKVKPNPIQFDKTAEKGRVSTAARRTTARLRIVLLAIVIVVLCGLMSLPSDFYFATEVNYGMATTPPPPHPYSSPPLNKSAIKCV